MHTFQYIKFKISTFYILKMLFYFTQFGYNNWTEQNCFENFLKLFSPNLLLLLKKMRFYCYFLPYFTNTLFKWNHLYVATKNMPQADYKKFLWYTDQIKNQTWTLNTINKNSNNFVNIKYIELSLTLRSYFRQQQSIPNKKIWSNIL